jgi:hypothetical protein
MLKGRIKLAPIEAMLTILKRAKIIIHKNRLIKIAFGLKKRKTPRLVATPLPPLNFKYGEKSWPRIVESPTEINKKE